MVAIPSPMQRQQSKDDDADGMLLMPPDLIEDSYESRNGSFEVEYRESDEAETMLPPSSGDGIVPGLEPIDETDGRTMVVGNLSSGSLLDGDGDFEDDDEEEVMGDVSTPLPASETGGNAEEAESETSSIGGGGCSSGYWGRGMELKSEQTDMWAVLTAPRSSSPTLECAAAATNANKPGLQSLLRSCVACSGHAHAQQCAQSQCSCDRSSSKQRVTFCEPMITRMMVRPKTPPEEITDYYYTRDQYQEFKVESNYHHEPVNGDYAGCHNDAMDVLFCGALPDFNTSGLCGSGFQCYSDALKDVPLMTVFTIDDCSRRSPWGGSASKAA